MKWCRKGINIAFKNVELTIDYTASVNLEKLIMYPDGQLKLKFYDKILLEMKIKMIALKNGVRMGTDEQTGDMQKPIGI